MRNSFSWLGRIVFVAIGIVAVPIFCPAADRPNFVWLLSEDNSKHYLSLYDEGGASTPHINKLAEQGLVFDHAFSCSPVCSVARTTLMTSVFAPRIGTNFHRKIKPVTLPPDWHLFPAYLRKAGYYASNNVKEDYNTAPDKQVWDDSSKKATWQNRPSAEVPFFHMHSFAGSHESSLHFTTADVQSVKPHASMKNVPLAPYHPDTELFRYTHARYLDHITKVDDFVGAQIAELDKEGLLEDTFVFYFGDHGGVLPRSKGFVYESGLHVPLVVRIPEKWKHLVDRQRGSRVGGFVSFVDFGPTVLNLAGITVPSHVDGKPFLGKGVTATEMDSRDEAIGYADRFDEKYDLCRSLRKGKYKYVRNYQSFYPDSLRNNYRYNMLVYTQWRDMYHDDKLNPVQKQFFQAKQPEALYDLSKDPHETVNLAADPNHLDVLVAMRTALRDRLIQLPDLSFYPESYLAEKAFDDPIKFGEENRKEIARLIDIADLCLNPTEATKPKLQASLESGNCWVRYWGLICCSVLGERAEELVPLALECLKDEEPLVRVRAAEFLGIVGKGDPVAPLREVLAKSESPLVTLLTLNTVVFLRDGPWDYEFLITGDDVLAKSDEIQRRLSYLSAGNKQ